MNPTRSARSALLAAAAAAALAVTGSLAALPASASTPGAAAEATAVSVAPAAAAAAAPTVDRISGPDRFAVAVAISKEGYPGTNGVAFLVTGQNYPDALGAAPAAVHVNGPLLLTTTAAIPQIVLDELDRLQPNLVVVVGGPASVSKNVIDQLDALPFKPAVTRIAGDDRYDTSREIIDYAFSSSYGPAAYVATGTNFPDSLSAGAVAGSVDSPVLLVNGGADELDLPSSSTLTARDFTTIKVVGGTAAVSPGIKSDLENLFPTVTRLAGADRFQTSVAVNRDGFSSAARVFLATGFTFPDALAGAALAGKLDAPLFVVPGDCVPKGVLSEIGRLGATRVTLLGGPAALSPAVQSLQPCDGPE